MCAASTQIKGTIEVNGEEYTVMPVKSDGTTYAAEVTHANEQMWYSFEAEQVSKLQFRSEVV
jgi:hypothetical protein